MMLYFYDLKSTYFPSCKERMADCYHSTDLLQKDREDVRHDIKECKNR
jgi:hypothetical protein